MTSNSVHKNIITHMSYWGQLLVTSPVSVDKHVTHEKDEERFGIKLHDVYI